MNELPIGIFDSGVGGLTVLRAIRKRLPNENIIYLGDTARVPYGTKSPETIERYAVEDAGFLVNKGIKMLVIACNTASAAAREKLRHTFDIPILSVIGPGARMAVRTTKNGRIGVIATEATVESKAYENAIVESAEDREFEISQTACPLFVSLAEEGETDSPIAHMVAEKYLASLRDKNIDTLVLGCTHYPLLKNVISETISRDNREHVTLIDSADAVAEETAQLLKENRLLSDSSERGECRFYVTDAANRFLRLGERFLGEKLNHIEAVEI